MPDEPRQQAARAPPACRTSPASRPDEPRQQAARAGPAGSTCGARDRMCPGAHGLGWCEGPVPWHTHSLYVHGPALYPSVRDTPRTGRPHDPTGCGGTHPNIPEGESTHVAVKIRLKRMGKTRAPYYRIVVADSRKKRDGAVLEEIGKYHPTEHPSVIEVESERAQYWLGVGAQPTEQVAALLKITGDWQKAKGETAAGTRRPLRSRRPPRSSSRRPTRPLLSPATARRRPRTPRPPRPLRPPRSRPVPRRHLPRAKAPRTPRPHRPTRPDIEHPRGSPRSSRPRHRRRS